MRLDLPTVLLQWAAGGMLFTWVTTRRRELGIGYGWLLRSTYLVLALGALGAGLTLASGSSDDGAGVRDVGSAGVALGTALALGVSVVRRRAGVRGQTAQRTARRDRVAAMVGREPEPPAAPARRADDGGAASRAEFPPGLDLLAPAVGLVGLLGAAQVAGGPYPLALVRLVAGALLLGAVTDAMLLGHWYLVQPGLGREPIRELIRCAAAVWPVAVVALCWPTGMFQALDGTVDDGWGGILAWTWVCSAVSTIVLLGVAWLALKEREYSAVMAATGLLYLAILTGAGTDLVARAVLAS